MNPFFLDEGDTKNRNRRAIAISMLAFLSFSSSSIHAQESDSAVLSKSRDLQQLQVAEPKPVRGIPDVVFETNSPVAPIKTGREPPAPVTVKIVLNTAEPRPVPGIPDILIVEKADAIDTSTAPVSLQIAVKQSNSAVDSIKEPRSKSSGPEQLIDTKPSISETNIVQIPLNQTVTQIAADETQNTVEPMIPRGMQQDETPQGFRTEAETPLLSMPSTAKSAWYAGIALGRGGLGTGYQRTFQTIFSTGATAVSVVANTEDAMWKAYVGYRFLPNWSIEGGYWDFGEAGYSATISAPVATSLERRFRLRGIGADAVFWLPVSDSITGFARLGAVLVSAKASSAQPGGGLTALPAQSSNTINMHWGLGGQYDVNPDMTLRLEYETVIKAGDNSKFGTADILFWSFGVAYKF